MVHLPINPVLKSTSVEALDLQPVKPDALVHQFSDDSTEVKKQLKAVVTLLQETNTRLAALQRTLQHILVVAIVMMTAGAIAVLALRYFDRLIAVFT